MTKDDALEKKAENARELGLDYEPEQKPIEKNMTLACPSYLHDYTTPPQRTWVGLTDEEKNEITWGKTVYEILELAEAKLKEKNT
jgi:hypothetical protein